MEVLRPDQVDPTRLKEYDQWHYQFLVHRDTKAEFVVFKVETETGQKELAIPLDVVKGILADIDTYKKAGNNG